MPPNKKNSLVVGRGATAIYLILHHHFQNKEIIVPSNICYAAILPIYYSGNTPRFIDVDYPSGNPTYDNINNAINENTAAVLFPYMYGNITDEIIKVKELCQKHQLLLIEDCASAMGGIVNGQPVGSFGDYAIFSTGHAKNVDLDNGGLLVSDLPLNIITKDYSTLPIFNETIAASLINFSQNYSTFRRANQLSKIQELFITNRDQYKSLFLYQISDPKLIEKIRNSFSIAETSKSTKLAKYHLFAENLPSEICYPYTAGSLPWRFSVLIESPQKRQKIIQSLLSAHLFVSDWYPCIAPSFGDFTPFPNAKKAEERILNFSLQDTDENILKICDIIKLTLQSGEAYEKN